MNELKNAWNFNCLSIKQLSIDQKNLIICLIEFMACKAGKQQKQITISAMEHHLIDDLSISFSLIIPSGDLVV